MAILTFSRQTASLGDDVSQLTAQKLGYTYVSRKDVEQKIVNLGFPEKKLHKYDEKIPGFFASLAKDRDEYLDYLQTAVLEFASKNNCVIVGRGSSFILSNVKNHLAVRVVAEDSFRIRHFMELYNIDEKQAKKRLAASDKQRAGFHKSFFNCQVEEQSLYHAIVNTSLLGVEAAADMIAGGIKNMSPEAEKQGMEQIEELLICQRIVNMLILEYGLNINFLRATARDGKVTLHGVADSSAIVNRALTITQAELPEYVVESAVNVVQDFKAYPQ